MDVTNCKDMRASDDDGFDSAHLGSQLKVSRLVDEEEVLRGHWLAQEEAEGLPALFHVELEQLSPRHRRPYLR